MTARTRGRRMAEAAADKLVRRFAVVEAPVNVETLASDLGADIRFQPFERDDDVSGLLLRTPGRRPVIGVNKANSAARQRFTIAHELGHLHLHEGKELILDRLVRVNFRSSASSMATDLEEREANSFAAALLMPQLLVIRGLQDLISGEPRPDDKLVEDLAKKFDVSSLAMRYRMINLGLMSPG